MLYFRLVLNMATQLQLNQTRKAYIINNMQTPSNCAINPFEIVEIWVSHYPGLPFTDDNGKFIWAYIMDDAMNWNNLHYESIRNSRRKYLGFPIPQSDNIWKPEATVKVSPPIPPPRQMSDFIKPKPTGFIQEMITFARKKAAISLTSYESH